MEIVTVNKKDFLKLLENVDLCMFCPYNVSEYASSSEQDEAMARCEEGDCVGIVYKQFVLNEVGD